MRNHKSFTAKPETDQRMFDLLNKAKKIPLTDDEHNQFMIINRTGSFDLLPKLIAKIGERTKLPLSSGRVAHDAIGKFLLVVD